MSRNLPAPAADFLPEAAPALTRDRPEGASVMDQKIEAKGRVIRDPETKKTSNGRLLARVTVAADEVSRNGNPIDLEENKWQVAVFWGKEAEEISKGIKKGALVRISGEETSRQYEDRNGHMKSTTELTAATVEKLEPRMEIIGNLVRDPELRTISNGDVMVRISVAADEVKKEGAPLDPSQNKFHTAVFWGEEAKQYADTLKKGAHVQLTGDLVTREYEGKEGPRTSFEIQRGSIQLHERGKAPVGERGRQPARAGDDLSR
jgi:single-strand DNA-binding protein